MIKGERIILRLLEQKDLEKLRKLRNDPDTNFFLTYVAPISEPLQKIWFEKISTDSTKMYLVITNPKEEFIGIVRCDEWDKINRSIRVGLDISPEFRKQGYATEAYRLLLNYLFFELSINRIWLLVVDFNTVAISLYKKLGFKVEGKQRQAIYRNNKFNDYIMMGILKKEYEKK